MSYLTMHSTECIYGYIMASHISKPALGCAGPNWEQFWSAQVPSQLALIGPIGLMPALVHTVKDHFHSEK